MIPTGSQPVAEVSIDREHELAAGWSFDATVRRTGPGPATHHRLTLAWVDYEYWSHGAAAPERVAKAVIETVLELTPERAVPEQFDAAAARRWARGFDDRVRERVGG